MSDTCWAHPPRYASEGKFNRQSVIVEVVKRHRDCSALTAAPGYSAFVDDAAAGEIEWHNTHKVASPRNQTMGPINRGRHSVKQSRASVDIRIPDVVRGAAFDDEHAFLVWRYSEQKRLQACQLLDPTSGWFSNSTGR